MVMDNQEKICQIALSLVKGVGSILWKKLISQFGAAQAVFQSNVKDLTHVPGSSRRLAQEILKKDTLQTAQALFLANQKKKKKITSVG